MSSTLVDKAVGSFARRLDRRSMLRRSTFAATAMVAAPTEVLLRPTSAYAAVCRCLGRRCPCGSLCCDAYTEFCCTLTGKNGCPPGTVAAGWWKVDGSQFCGSAPRYYLDCNAQCGTCKCRGSVCNGSCSGTPCDCAFGDCNNRKAGCVKFRYGQCNQHIGCVGPIVCRVVTCTPPWIFDDSCTTASRTDNNTAHQTKPCLEVPFGGFDGMIDVGGAIQVTGWAIDQNLRDGVDARIFIDERPMTSTPANLTRADVGAAHPYYGADHGFDVTVDASAGRHVVCVFAHDQGSNTSTFLAFAAVEVSGPLGALDHLTVGPSTVTVNGWMVNPLSAGAAVTVRLVIDEIEVTRVETALPRPDVAAANPGDDPNCGYTMTAAVAPGPHQVCVELVYSSGRTARHQCSEVIVP